jgi:pimeloyl-ACP methyl ester carboxylesterase
VPADYQPPTYVQDMAALIARLDVETVDWVGVSLGGLMGMMLAIQPKSPIRKLVLDDIGAYIGIDALKRIAGYVGTDPSFETLDALEAYMREVNAPYGPLTDAQWRHLVHHGARQNPETGRWHQHYDPRLGEPFKAGFSEPVDLWPVWDAIACPVLVLRGSQSDILSADTAAEMLQRKPSAQLIEFDGVGHAPMMMEDAQIQPVRAWLSA